MPRGTRRLIPALRLFLMVVAAGVGGVSSPDHASPRALLLLGARSLEPTPGGPTAPRDPALGSLAPPVERSGGAPRITFDRTSHDFGSARQQETKATRFVVGNSGGAPLHVSVHGDCGCTAVSIAAEDDTSGEAGTPSREIAVGEEAAVRVTFDTGRSVGHLGKTVHVTSDDPMNPATDLTVEVDVSQGILLAPQGFFFGMALVGTTPEATLEARWKEGVGKPFRITSIETTDLQPAIAKPRFAIERFDAPPWHGYRLTLSLPESPPVGAVTGSILIRTDDPDDAALQAPMAGIVSGRVVVTTMHPSFGVVRQGHRAVLPIHVHGFDASVDLGRVTAASRRGTVDVRVRALDEVSMKGLLLVEIELPTDAPTGTIEDVIDLSTEVEGEERIELSVGGVVVAN